MKKVLRKFILSVRVGLRMISEFNPECTDLKSSGTSWWVTGFRRAHHKPLRETGRSLGRLPGSQFTGPASGLISYYHGFPGLWRGCRFKSQTGLLGSTRPTCGMNLDACFFQLLCDWDKSTHFHRISMQSCEVFGFFSPTLFYPPLLTAQ